LGREGKVLPKVKRGRKPKVKAEGQAALVKSDSYKTLPTTVPMETYHFIINGVKVTVSGKAKTVYIAPDSMTLNF